MALVVIEGVGLAAVEGRLAHGAACGHRSTFLGANISQGVRGGWVTLTVAGALPFVMLT
jgi:K+ transporter